MRHLRLLLVICAVGAVTAIATFAVAQTPTPSQTPAPSETPTPGPRDNPGGPAGRPMKAIGRGGPGGPGGPGIHGEFVAPNPDGGFQTIATQVGEVTAVDADSITLKSEDGFVRSYVINDDTSVHAGRTGISSIEVGDTAHVMAIVADGTATAKHVSSR